MMKMKIVDGLENEDGLENDIDDDLNYILSAIQ